MNAIKTFSARVRISFALSLLVSFPLVGEAYAPEGIVELPELTTAEVIERLADRLPLEHRPAAGKLGRLLVKSAKQFRLSPALILALIETESSFRASALSSEGAVGLMQIKPSTAAYVAARYRLDYSGPADLEDPAHNIRLGIAYLAYLKNRFGHSQHYLAAYNLGPARLLGRLKREEGLGNIELYVSRIHGRTRQLQTRTKAPAGQKLSAQI